MEAERGDLAEEAEEADRERRSIPNAAEAWRHLRCIRNRSRARIDFEKSTEKFKKSATLGNSRRAQTLMNFAIEANFKHRGPVQEF